jgi:hypothetical protein
MVLPPSYQTSSGQHVHKRSSLYFSTSFPPSNWSHITSLFLSSCATTDRTERHRRSSTLPGYADGDDTALNEVWDDYSDCDAWWMECSEDRTYPSDATPLWEYRSECILRAVLHGKEVEAIVHDGLIRIVTQHNGNYGALYVKAQADANSQCTEYIFARSAMPTRFAIPNAGEFNVSDIFERQIALLNAVASSQCSAMQSSSPAPADESHDSKASHSNQWSDKVTYRQDVPDVGEFIAFADGRATCRFADRTLAEHSGMSVSLVLPDGSRLTVQPHCATSTLSQYVKAMNEFHEWAFASEDDIASTLSTQRHLQQAVNTQLERNDRLMTLSEHSSTLPPAKRHVTSPSLD